MGRLLLALSAWCRQALALTAPIEKLGIDRRLYTAGNQKAMLDPFQAENADDVAHLRALQDDIHSQFIALVKSRRGSRLKGADSDIFSGAFWTGQKALELGLVDRIGEIRPVLEEQFGDKVQLRLLSARKSMFGFRTNQPGVDAISTDASAQMIDTLMLKLEERWKKCAMGFKMLSLPKLLLLAVVIGGIWLGIGY